MIVQGEKMNILFIILKIVATVLIIYPTLFFFCASLCRLLSFFNIFVMEATNKFFDIAGTFVRCVFKIHDEPIWDCKPFDNIKELPSAILNYIFECLLPLSLHVLIILILW